MLKTTLLLSLLLCLYSAQAQKKKSKDKSAKENITDYVTEEPVADTATKFTGVIKYLMTSDDPSSKDSMYIIFGEEKIRVVMFYPGYKENEIFRDNMIANFSDSSFLVLDDRKKTIKREKLDGRNHGTQINLSNSKKTGKVMNIICPEYAGEMILKDGETYQAASLVSKQLSFIRIADYNFLNIQPVVQGYKIVLGYRTRSADNENTYIMAYKIEPGNTDAWFDLSGYKNL